MKKQEAAQRDNSVEVLDANYRSYLAVAGTNIEDLDRAIDARATLAPTETSERSSAV